MSQSRNKPTHLGRSRHIRLSPLMDSVLETASERTGVNPSELVRMALAEFLMGDYETRIKKRIRSEGFQPGTRRKKKGGKPATIQRVDTATPQ